MGLLLKAFLGKLLEGAEEETEGGDLGTVLKLAKGITKGEAKGEAEVDKETKAIEPTTGRLDETIETEPSSFNEAFVNELVGKPTDLSKSGRLSYLGKSLADVLRSKIGAPSVGAPLSPMEQALQKDLYEKYGGGTAEAGSLIEQATGIGEPTTTPLFAQTAQDRLGEAVSPERRVGGVSKVTRKAGGVSETIDFELPPEEIARRKGLEKGIVQRAEARTKLKLGKLVSQSNFETILGITHDAVGRFAKGLEEGGTGGAVQAKVSDVAGEIGDLPGYEFLPKGVRYKEVGGKFAESNTYPGKRQEMILKMTPMLTQQAMKAEGSVRLMRSVLAAIGVSIPEKGTDPKTARNQLEGTLRSFYRFARAAEILNMDFDKYFKGVDLKTLTQKDVGTWVEAVKSMGDRVEIRDDELEALNYSIGKSLRPLDEAIARIEQEREDKQPGATPDQIRSIFREIRGGVR